MYEIAISHRSSQAVPHTLYDAAVGLQFGARESAERYCEELNLLCRRQRFVVIRVSGQPAYAEMRAAA